MLTGQITGSTDRHAVPPLTVGAAIVASSLTLVFLPLASGLAVFGAILFFAASVFRPALGLALVCSLLTVEGISAGDLGMTEVRMAGLAAAGAWVLHMLLFGKALRVDRAFGFILLLTAWAGLSFLWAGEVEPAGSYYLTLIQLVLLYLLAFNVVNDRTDMALALGGLALGALLTSGMSIAIFTGNLFERARAFEAQNANAYAAAVGLGIVGAVYFVRQSRAWWLRALAFAAAVGLAVPLVLAQSRSAWMATGAALAVLIWHTRHRRRNFILVIGTAMTLLAGIYFSGLVSYTLVDRAVGFVQLHDRGSNRLDIWLVAAGMIRENPLAGVGFNQFPREYNRYRAGTSGIRQDLTNRRDPHSLFFGVTAELGLVGLLLLLLALWSLWRRGDLPPGTNPWLSRTLLAYMLLFSVGGTTLLAKHAWVALGLAARARVLDGRDAQAERAEE